jgi:2-C-methyl-D-erythritol 4-phosphate cytidylyltransferase
VRRAEIIWTVVVGGGSGRRFGLLKQYEALGDARVIDWSLRVAAAASDGVVVVVPAEDAEREQAVAGGDSRSASVRAGLAAVPDEATIVCVHDAARPFATADMFERVCGAVVDGADAAIPGIEVTDTIKVVAPDGGGVLSVIDTPDRATLVAVQTPQAFRAAALRAAHAAGGEATDDAAMIERSGGRVVVVDGDLMNRKITVPEDLDWARRHAAAIDGALEEVVQQ